MPMMMIMVMIMTFSFFSFPRFHMCECKEEYAVTRLYPQWQERSHWICIQNRHHRHEDVCGMSEALADLDDRMHLFSFFIRNLLFPHHVNEKIRVEDDHMNDTHRLAESLWPSQQWRPNTLHSPTVFLIWCNRCLYYGAHMSDVSHLSGIFLESDYFPTCTVNKSCSNIWRRYSDGHVLPLVAPACLHQQQVVLHLWPSCESHIPPKNGAYLFSSSASYSFPQLVLIHETWCRQIPVLLDWNFIFITWWERWNRKEVKKKTWYFGKVNDERAGELARAGSTKQEAGLNQLISVTWDKIRKQWFNKVSIDRRERDITLRARPGNDGIDSRNDSRGNAPSSWMKQERVWYKLIMQRHLFCMPCHFWELCVYLLHRNSSNISSLYAKHIGEWNHFSCFNWHSLIHKYGMIYICVTVWRTLFLYRYSCDFPAIPWS